MERKRRDLAATDAKLLAVAIEPGDTPIGRCDTSQLPSRLQNLQLKKSRKVASTAAGDASKGDKGGRESQNADAVGTPLRPPEPNSPPAARLRSREAEEDQGGTKTKKRRSEKGAADTPSRTPVIKSPHPIISGTKVFFGRIMSFVADIPTKRDGVFFYSLTDIEGEIVETDVHLSPLPVLK